MALPQEKNWQWMGVLSPLHPESLRQSLDWALQTFYQHPHDFAQMRSNAMRADRTWDKAASLYERLFAPSSAI